MHMTSRERTLCALNNHEPDYVPIFDFLYSRPLFKEVLGTVPGHYEAESVMKCSYKIGYDLAVIPFGGFSGLQDFDAQDDIYIDEWGTTFEKKESTWPVDSPLDYPLKTINDLKNYIFPDASIANRLNGINTALKIARETNLAVVGSVRGPFSATWFLFGIENFMMFLYDNPDFINIVLEKCTDFYIEGGRRMVEAGVDALLFADDYGGKASLLISPEHFRQYILPHTRRMVKEFKKLNIPVIMHSDGNILSVLDSLVGTGIHAWHPMERGAGIQIDEIKKTYGQDICLIGNVNNKTTLVSGSLDDIVEETKECIRIAAPGGGYILSSDHSVHDDIPNENVFSLYKAGRKYGRYPINIEIE